MDCFCGPKTNIFFCFETKPPVRDGQTNIDSRDIRPNHSRTTIKELPNSGTHGRANELSDERSNYRSNELPDHRTHELPCTTDGVCHTITHPWGGFPCSIGRQPRGCQIPNDTSSESSRRDVSKTDLFGSGRSASCGDIEHEKLQQLGLGVCDRVISTVVYGTSTERSIK